MQWFLGRNSTTPDSLGVFDSHSRDANGKKTSNGTACYVTKSSAEALCDILFKNFYANRTENNEFFQFNVYKFTAFDIELDDLVGNGATADENVSQNSGEEDQELVQIRREQEEIDFERLVISSEPLNEGGTEKANLFEDFNMVTNLTHFLSAKIL